MENPALNANGKEFQTYGNGKSSASRTENKRGPAQLRTTFADRRTSNHRKGRECTERLLHRRRNLMGKTRCVRENARGPRRRSNEQQSMPRRILSQEALVWKRASEPGRSRDVDVLGGSPLPVISESVMVASSLAEETDLSSHRRAVKYCGSN